LKKLILELDGWMWETEKCGKDLFLARQIHENVVTDLKQIEKDNIRPKEFEINHLAFPMGLYHG